MAKQVGVKIISKNKKAPFNYYLSEFLECGIELFGTEIKSIRDGGVNINDAYVFIRNMEAYVINMNISPYKKGNIFNKDPLRDKKLLMHKKEILRYSQKAEQGGFSIVPTKIYFKDGRCKIEIALAKGKKLYDKREDIKNRDIKKDIAQKIKDYN